MPKRSSIRPKRPTDPNALAFEIMKEATAEKRNAPAALREVPTKNPAAVALGRLGGKKGGPARAAKLSKKKLSDIAKKAAEARWKKPK